MTRTPFDREDLQDALDRWASGNPERQQIADAMALQERDAARSLARRMREFFGYTPAPWYPEEHARFHTLAEEMDATDWLQGEPDAPAE